MILWTRHWHFLMLFVLTNMAKMKNRSIGSVSKLSKTTRKAVKSTKTRIQRNKAVVKSSKRNIDSESAAWYTVFTKGDKEYNEYMANEWGYERRGDIPLFEKISLEGAQSGLSWLTILRKRDAYRRVFYNFDIDKVAAMSSEDVQRILQEDDENKRNIIVRHRGKIESVINNAKCIQQLQKEIKNDNNSRINAGADHYHGAFDAFLWSFVNNQPILNMSWNGDLKSATSQSPESNAMSKALKKRGFRFVGPTTCYAMMQSIGMVIDHPKDSKEWMSAKERLESRSFGYQKR